MDLTFSEEDFAFQQEVRDWIAENFPAEMRDRYKRAGKLNFSISPGA